jgi:hypothetical protein
LFLSVSFFVVKIFESILSNFISFIKRNIKKILFLCFSLCFLYVFVFFFVFSVFFLSFCFVGVLF